MGPWGEDYSGPSDHAQQAHWMPETWLRTVCTSLANQTLAWEVSPNQIVREKISATWQKHALCNNHSRWSVTINLSLCCCFFLVQMIELTHSEEVASSLSAPSPDCGTISSLRACWGLSLPRLATWSSSETKNCGGSAEHESGTYRKNRQWTQNFKPMISDIRLNSGEIRGMKALLQGRELKSLNESKKEFDLENRSKASSI